MAKKVYSKPQAEMIHFNYEDIVTCSNTPCQHGNNPHWPWPWGNLPGPGKPHH